LHMLYNDAYSDILQAKHPDALLRPVLEVWGEAVPSTAPVIAQALAGVATPLYVAPFQVLRGPDPELVWFNFALTPVLAAANLVCGVMCVITESTLLVGAHAQAQRERYERAAHKYLM
jgi:hypothetical protein